MWATQTPAVSVGHLDTTYPRWLFTPCSIYRYVQETPGQESEDLGPILDYLTHSLSELYVSRVDFPSCKNEKDKWENLLKALRIQHHSVLFLFQHIKTWRYERRLLITICFSPLLQEETAASYHIKNLRQTRLIKNSKRFQYFPGHFDFYIAMTLVCSYGPE